MLSFGKVKGNPTSFGCSGFATSRDDILVHAPSEFGLGGLEKCLDRCLGGVFVRDAKFSMIFWKDWRSVPALMACVRLESMFV